MPIAKQRERGHKSPYSARYGVNTGRCTGIDLSQDASMIPDTALRQGINGRVNDGIVVNRGGQSETESGMNGCIQGLIDIPGGGVRGVTAHDDGALGGTDFAVVGMFDENLRQNPVDATNFSFIQDDPFTEHPVEADPGGDTWSDTFARYAYWWWDGSVVFQDKDTKQLFKFVLPENGALPADLSVEPLFDLIVPGESVAFDISSFLTMPQIGTVRGAEPLYFGTMAGGVVAYSQGQMIRLLVDATFAGRVTLFTYNGRIYAAGEDKVMFQTAGWSQGGGGNDQGFTDITIPATPVEFHPMAGIEGLGFGWLAGWDDNHASGPPGTFGNQTGYLLKIDDSSGTPVITTGWNGAFGGESMWSFDDLAIGPSGAIYVSYRHGGPASFLASIASWNGTTFSVVKSYAESQGMVPRIIGTSGRVYWMGWNDDANTEINSWDENSLSEVVSWGFGFGQSPWDMAIF